MRSTDQDHDWEQRELPGSLRPLVIDQEAGEDHQTEEEWIMFARTVTIGRISAGNKTS